MLAGVSVPLLHAPRARRHERRLARACWRHWPARFSSTTPSAPTSSTSPAPPTRRRRGLVGARPSSASGPRSNGPSMRSPAPPRSSATSASTSWPPTSSGARCSPSCTPARRGRSTPPGSCSSIREPRRLLRRLGPRRQRIGRHPALRRGSRPVQPRALRPRRRTRNPERGVPHPLGRAQRPLPQHRHQALPTIPSSATSPDLQPTRPRRRPRPDALHLHRRARLQAPKTR